jgi:hypothetical protein
MPAEETAPAPAPAEEEPLTVFEVPRDIDFFFASDMNKVLYDSMTMENMKGNIIMKDGILKMDKLGFNTFGGSVLTNGSYNTQNMKDPKFSFDMDVKDMQLKQAYNGFSMMKQYGQIAKDMDGKFSTLMVVGGSLGQDMMPVYKTVNGNGKIVVKEAVIKDNKMLVGISKVSKAGNLNPMKIQDVLVKFKIVDGNLVVEPFDVKAGDTKMNVSGKQSIEGKLDYLVKMDVPAGSLGSTVNNTVGGLTGNANNSKNLKFDVKIGGTASDPKFGLAGGSMQDQVKDEVKDQVADKLDDVKQQTQEQIDAEKARLQAELDAKKKEEEARLKKEAEDKAKAEQDRLKKEAEDKLKNKLKGFGK